MTPPPDCRGGNSSQGTERAAAHQPASGARAAARLETFDGAVLHEFSEANVGSSVVLVFRAVGAGSTTVSLALTKGDTSAKALESRRFLVNVR